MKTRNNGDSTVASEFIIVTESLGAFEPLVCLSSVETIGSQMLYVVHYIWVEFCGHIFTYSESICSCWVS